jgi:hypothetical protein
MNKVLKLICVALDLSGRFDADAQSPVSVTTESSTGTESHLEQIPMTGEISNQITNSYFICTLIHKFKENEKVKALVSDDHTWSLETNVLQVATNRFAYPVLALVKCSGGDFQSLVPAIFTAKGTITAGAMLTSDGYQIQAQQAMQAGESASVLVIGDVICSIEAIKGSDGETNARPSLLVIKQDAKRSERDSAIEAWRIETEHFNK